jgi:hypothetical protein
MVALNPPAGQTAYAQKTLSLSGAASGHHHMSFDARVNGAPAAGIAKVAVVSDGSDWDRKFEILLGSSLSVSHDPTALPDDVVAQVAVGHWYHVELDMDLSSDSLTVSIDGQPGTRLPMAAGNVIGLALVGADAPGGVNVDNLVGVAD